MKVAILTGGGVAPGMNAAVRAVAQAAFYKGWEVAQVEAGYAGLLGGAIRPLDRSDLPGLMQRGGTLLGTERSEEFGTDESRKRVVRRLEEAGVDGLAVIGGGGSLAGASSLAELGVRVVGIPATIDNDIPETDLAIGVDTAMNRAVAAIDQVRDTTTSHGRAHAVEVLGRDCGYLALMSAIGGGAQAALVPEFETDPDGLLGLMKEAYGRGRLRFVVVVAEGAKPTAVEFCDHVNASDGNYKCDLTTLRHTLSGGAPSAFDRVLAGRLGAAAVDGLADGNGPWLVGLAGENVRRIALTDVVGRKRELDEETYALAGVLAGMRR